LVQQIRTTRVVERARRLDRANSANLEVEVGQETVIFDPEEAP
jgi:hypothetical protein